MIRILTDSAADLTCADAALPGVTVVPLQVNFANGDTALDGVDITGDEYYARLKTEDKLPRTSQPSVKSAAPSKNTAIPAMTVRRKRANARLSRSFFNSGTNCVVTPP